MGQCLRVTTLPRSSYLSKHPRHRGSSTAHGVTAYNKVAEGALGVYEGTDLGQWVDGIPTYDPIAKWWETVRSAEKGHLERGTCA